MKDIKVLGIDLAKDVFQLHGTDAKGNRLLTKRLSRRKLIEYMANSKLRSLRVLISLKSVGRSITPQGPKTSGSISIPSSVYLRFSISHANLPPQSIK